MIRNPALVFRAMKLANERFKLGHDFEKKWHVMYHYMQCFQSVKAEVIVNGDSDGIKAFNAFCALCSLDLRRNYTSIELWLAESKAQGIIK